MRTRKSRDTTDYITNMAEDTDNPILLMERICELMDKKGDAQEAYSLAVKARNKQALPAQFFAYMALSAFYAGFHAEAFRISKELIYYRGITDPRYLVNHAYYQHTMNPPISQSKLLSASHRPNSRVAIIFTGRLRTFDKTYHNILHNLVDPNMATTFLFCECDRTAEQVASDVKTKWGSFGGVITASERPSEFDNLIDYLLKTQPNIQPDKFNASVPPNYIVNSGSILEYYQFSKGYDLMLEYERKHSVRFDIIVRSRLDIVFGNKMNILDFFDPSLQRTRRAFSDPSIYFESLGNSSIAAIGTHEPAPHVADIPVAPPHDIDKAILSNQYIWTLGHNQVWIGRREAVGQLSFLCYSYGRYNSARPSTFNSESQFTLFCQSRNIHHIRLSMGAGSKYCASRSLNEGLLKSPEDDIDTDIIITILRPRGWGGFTEA